jgi:hypothetical protein
MEIMIYFLGAALAVASVFLMLDTQQSRRVNRIVKETRKVEPLFLLRAAERKLLTLNSLLYDVATVNSSGRKIKLNGDKRQVLSARLSSLVNEHRDGNITLQAYHRGLNDLLKKAGER